MILALEFSSPIRTVSVLARSSTGGTLEVLNTVSDNGSRALKPLSLIQAALAGANAPQQSVEVVGVGLGPGSYTGIRSSIALAQGWQLARPIQVSGVSSVESLALQAQANGWFGEVLIAIDAQRKEVYVAKYQLAPERRELTEPLRLVSIEELRALANHSGTIAIGPEVTRWLDHGRVVYPQANDVGRLAWPAHHQASGDQLEPIYLRETTFVKARQIGLIRPGEGDP